MITIQSGKMIIPEEERFVGFAGDDRSITKQFILYGASDTGCSYTLYLRFDDDRVTSADLTAESGDDGLILTWDVRARNLLKSGIVMAQLKITDNGSEIAHTSWDYFVVGASAELADDGGEVDVLHRTEFEERLALLNASKVDKTLTIAGVDLQDDLTSAKLRAALSVPSKTSELTNDSGFLTQHQDVSGKMDRYVTLNAEDTSSLLRGQVFAYNNRFFIKSSLATPVGAQTEIADRGDIPTKTSQLTNDSGFLTAHQDISGKADKATTLSGYGITDAYTKTQVDGMIPTVPTKTSQLTNDSGFLTAHQDISGKADKATTLSGYGITDAYTKTQVDSLITADPIPSYVVEESESVLFKAFSHTGLGRTVRFIAVSDSHNDATEASYSYTRKGNLHCGQAIKYISDRIGLDFVAVLGDMTWAGTAHTSAQYRTAWLQADLQEMNRFLADGCRGIPNIRVVGNHDQCATTDANNHETRLQNSGAYHYFGRYNAGKGDAKSGYGYYDIESAKLRVIYLNTSDTTNTASSGTLLSVSEAQKNWLCETLIDVNTKSDAASWRILLTSHAPLDMVSDIGKTSSGTPILTAYVNGGTYGSYTFTNHSARIVGNCHGHVHCYSYGYIADKIRRFTIPNSCFYDNNHYAGRSGYEAWAEQTTYNKTQDSRTDTSFSLVTMDLDNDVCYVDNYGAGYDRVFSLDYQKTPASISSFVYSGTTTVGSTIDISAISATVTYDDSSTAQITGNVTVSPSTIQQVGNNTVAVSYTENGTTVSANITIVGTVVPVVRLLDLDRTVDVATVNQLVPFDTTKCYKNISYGNTSGYNANCTVNATTQNSLSMKESGTGGITVAYPVELPNTSHSYTITFDYSGTGAARAYYRIYNSSGTALDARQDIVNISGGTSGSVNVTIPAPTGAFKWLIIMFSSNTGGAKDYTNVSLTENS